MISKARLQKLEQRTKVNEEFEPIVFSWQYSTEAERLELIEKQKEIHFLKQKHGIKPSKEFSWFEKSIDAELEELRELEKV